MRRAAPVVVGFLLGFAVSCELEPIDYRGKACPTGQCPTGYACVSGSCVAGSGGGSAGGTGGGTAGGTAGGSAGGLAGGSAGGAAGGSAGGTAGGSAGGTAGGSAGGTAGGSAGGTAGGSAGGAAGGSAGGTAGGSAGGTAGGSAGGAAGGTGDGGLQTLTLRIAQDFDDATWVAAYLPDGGPVLADDERLRYDSTNPNYIEVGDDLEQCRAGFRFALPLARNTTIVTATLTLKRTDANTASVNTMTVRVWDTADVPQFSDSHVHAPELHGGGVWSLLVGSWALGPGGVMAPTTSPDLGPLVQHIVNRADWVSGNHIGFVVAPEFFTGLWTGFEDKRAGLGNEARLDITWR